MAGRNKYRSGFAAIIGRCNVGKSTLLNALLKEKVSIVSPIPQTTRYAIRGIYTDDDAQIVFVDTPGLHLCNLPLAKVFNAQAVQCLGNVDVILYVVDINDAIGREERNLISLIESAEVPVVVVLNKKDAGKRFVNDYIAETRHFAKYYIPTSAIRQENMDELISAIKKLLPESDALYYPSGVKTDFPLRLHIAELVREKLLNRLKDEIPHSIAVIVEKMEEHQNILLVEAKIILSEERHKPIVIGKNGALLKEAGREARKEIKALLRQKVFLKLWVKVQEKWEKKTDTLRELGYVD